MNLSLPAFRKLAIAEAISFLVLLVFSYLKNFQDGSEDAVMVLGGLHGLLFVTYVLAALGLRDRLDWSNRTLGLVLLGAVIPFGGFVVERKLAQGFGSPASTP